MLQAAKDGVGIVSVGDWSTKWVNSIASACSKFSCLNLSNGT